MVSFHCVAVDVCAAVIVENEARLGLPEGQLTGNLDFRSKGWGDSEIEILALWIETDLCVMVHQNDLAVLNKMQVGFLKSY